MQAELKELDFILVLEDDEELRELLLDVLDSSDFRVQGAVNAAEAVVKAEQHNFDIVISDVRMAGSIDDTAVDGLGALVLLKKRKPNLKCIVMTGYADDEAPLRAFQIHVDDYLYKPFDVSTLLKSIEQIRGAGKRRSLFQKLWDKYIVKPRVTRSLEQLSQVRVETLNTYRIGIRSKHISWERAWELWLDWEKIDVPYSRLDLGLIEPTQNLIVNAINRYSEFRKSLEAKVTSRVQPKTKTDAEIATEKELKALFRCLYAKVLAGDVDLEAFLMAAFVRSLNPKRRELDPDMEELYSNLWLP